MRLIRHGSPGEERPGVVRSVPEGTDERLDVAAFGEDFDERFFSTGGLERLRSWLEEKRDVPRVPHERRLGPPICRPSKIVCVGLNYREHAAETGATPPPEPMLFMKASTSLCGADDDLVLPHGSSKVDWEVELGIVVGRTSRYLDASSAREHIAGFVLANDVSERAFQKERGGQFTKGKSADTFCPIGPWLVTLDEAPARDAIELYLSVNGVERQRDTTAKMMANPFEVVAYVSQFMTLLPGDLLLTGTPAGVGAGLQPPMFLGDGDELVYGGTGLGEARKRVRAHRDSGLRSFEISSDTTS